MDGIEPFAERSESLAFRALRRTLFSRCAALCSAEALEYSRSGRDSPVCTLERGQCRQRNSCFSGHSRLYRVSRCGGGLLAGEPETGNPCPPATWGFFSTLWESIVRHSPP